MVRQCFILILPIWFLIMHIFVLNSGQINTQIIEDKQCPEGYFLHTDELCYPKIRKPCPFEKPSGDQSLLSTTTDTPISTTLNTRGKLHVLSCPENSIMTGEKCRRVMCSLGEYYRGMCLHPVCPPGLVWRGKKCQEPGYLTTLIEIDNVLVNELNEESFALKAKHDNEVFIQDSSTTTSKPLTTQPLPTKATTSYLTTSSTSKYLNILPTPAEINEVCCKVLTPRICKLYREKWLCFNRQYQHCDKRICSSPIVYLKAPEIKLEPPILVMPPNPQLPDCKARDCNNNNVTNTFDCSGCASSRPENCSPYCYSYICPKGTCSFMDLNEYCTYYPGQKGCTAEDGCLWNWC